MRQCHECGSAPSQCGPGFGGSVTLILLKHAAAVSEFLHTAVPALQWTGGQRCEPVHVLSTLMHSIGNSEYLLQPGAGHCCRAYPMCIAAVDATHCNTCDWTMHASDQQELILVLRLELRVVATLGASWMYTDMRVVWFGIHWNNAQAQHNINRKHHHHHHHHHHHQTTGSTLGLQQRVLPWHSTSRSVHGLALRHCSLQPARRLGSLSQAERPATARHPAHESGSVRTAIVPCCRVEQLVRWRCKSHKGKL